MNFVLIIFLLFCQVVLCQDPIHVREFHGVFGEKSESSYIDKYKDNSDVSVRAYVVSLLMKKAKYSRSPFSKLSIFNKWKKELEYLIKKHPTSIHLRYVRLLVQENAPSILGYSSDILNDKKVLESYLTKIDATDYLDKYIKQNTTL